MRPTWHEWALDIAKAVATRSEDPYVRVGAVLLRPDMSVAGVGYNGPSHGVSLDWSDRDGRRQFVIHAEVNALRYATKFDVRGGSMVATHISCSNCLVVMASYEIETMVYGELLGEAYDMHQIQAVAEVCRINLLRI